MATYQLFRETFLPWSQSATKPLLTETHTAVCVGQVNVECHQHVAQVQLANPFRMLKRRQQAASQISYDGIFDCGKGSSGKTPNSLDAMIIRNLV